MVYSWLGVITVQDLLKDTIYYELGHENGDGSSYLFIDVNKRKLINEDNHNNKNK